LVSEHDPGFRVVAVFLRATDFMFDLRAELLPASGRHEAGFWSGKP
jgi:hypothetical protein